MNVYPALQGNAIRPAQAYPRQQLLFPPRMNHPPGSIAALPLELQPASMDMLLFYVFLVKMKTKSIKI